MGPGHSRARLLFSFCFVIWPTAAKHMATTDVYFHISVMCFVIFSYSCWTHTEVKCKLWYRIMGGKRGGIDGEWHEERKTDEERGRLKEQEAGKKRKKWEAEGTPRTRSSKGRVSCVKWINVRGSFIVRLSWALPPKMPCVNRVAGALGQPPLSL